MSSKTAQKLIDTFPNVQRISFIGGEPTISDEHIEFLKMLIAKGTNKNIGLSYVTNLTGVTEELLELWDKFYRVHISVSIDGFDKVNEPLLKLRIHSLSTRSKCSVYIKNKSILLVPHSMLSPLV